MKYQANVAKYIIVFVLFLILVLGTIFAVYLPAKNQETISPQATIQEQPTFTPLVSPTVEANVTSDTDSQIPTEAYSEQSICSRIWGISPPTTLPEWLTTPANVDGLYTEVKYGYLAGKLISSGLVDAKDCPDGGLTPDGWSNTCGMEKAFSAVVSWQNQFNPEILQAAQENQIPAQLIKRLFAQETQFWPPTDLAPRAYGIGNVTSPGIEPLFIWYEDIYQNTCLDLFSNQCVQPYSSLDLTDQQNLRGLFISQHIHAYCPTCPNNTDVDKTKSSIDYFSKLIVANCYQVDLILNNDGFSPQKIEYEDAWRLVLANYTVGAGCIINGLEHIDPSTPFLWDSFTEIINRECGVNVSFINTITK